MTTENLDSVLEYVSIDKSRPDYATSVDNEHLRILLEAAKKLRDIQREDDLLKNIGFPTLFELESVLEKTEGQYAGAAMHENPICTIFNLAYIVRDNYETVKSALTVGKGT